MGAYAFSFSDKYGSNAYLQLLLNDYDEMNYKARQPTSSNFVYCVFLNLRFCTTPMPRVLTSPVLKKGQQSETTLLPLCTQMSSVTDIDMLPSNKRRHTVETDMSVDSSTQLSSMGLTSVTSAMITNASRSLIWMYFDKLDWQKNEKKKTVQCRLCKSKGR